MEKNSYRRLYKDAILVVCRRERIRWEMDVGGGKTGVGGVGRESRSRHLETLTPQAGYVDAA